MREVRIRRQGAPGFPKPEQPVSSYRVEQRHVHYRGRVFHFVSYDGHPANQRRGEQEMPPMWYLMGPGRRWPVMPQVIGQPEREVDQALLAWLEQQGIGMTIPQPNPAPRPFPDPSDPTRRPDAPPPPPAQPQPDGIPTPDPEPRPRPLDRRAG